MVKHTNKNKPRNTRRLCACRKRCECGKLAKDFIDGVPKCRLHSPMREGYYKPRDKTVEIPSRLNAKKEESVVETPGSLNTDKSGAQNLQ